LVTSASSLEHLYSSERDFCFCGRCGAIVSCGIFNTPMDDARCRYIYTLIESQDVADDAQEPGSVGDLVVVSPVPTRSTFNMSCHSNHLVCLLRVSKPLEPLKGDAHGENTFSSHKLCGIAVSPVHKFFASCLSPSVEGRLPQDYW
jgi:hypothetical protein